MKRLLASALLMAALCCSAVGSDREFLKIEPPPYQETFGNNAYADAKVFKAELEELKSPWRELFEGARESENGGYEIAPYDKLQSVEIIYKTDECAIVTAMAERYRTSFCAVAFLLVKNGKDFRVADIIRRTDLGYSYVDKMEVVPLKPEKYVHLHISTYRGGRRVGWNSDEFFVVKDGHFQPTLAVRDGFTMTPARPYHIFDQNAEIQVREGKLCMHVTRKWGLDKGVQEQKFDVDFAWNLNTEKWESPDLGKVLLEEPDDWNGEKLPKPPKAATH